MAVPRGENGRPVWWILAWIFGGGLLGAAVGVLFCDLAFDDEFVVLAFCGALSSE